MYLLATAALVVAVFLTSILSGVFGMAGGLVMMWILLFYFPAATAIAIHGFIQVFSNVSRAWFSRTFINWRIFFIALSGSLLAVFILALVQYSPHRATVSIAIGLMPILVWIPPRLFALDASRPSHAFTCGFLSGLLNVAVGVSGPTIDVFFVRTSLDRRTVVATKALLQTVSHTLKVIFYLGAVSSLTTAHWTMFAMSVPFAILGTNVGHMILTRMTDANFREWIKWIVTVIGIFYLVQGYMALT